MSATPQLNTPDLPATAAAIDQEVDRTLQLVDSWLDLAPAGPAQIIHRELLVLSPLDHCGPAVLLACHEATVFVPTREPLSWDPVRHGLFFRRLYERLRGERPWLSPEPLRALLDAEDFVTQAVQQLACAVDDLQSVESDRFDLVLSHATLERVADVPRVLSELCRITRPAGHGVHRLDYRDQRDHDRPLEHLTMEADAFQRLFSECSGACGNRWRPAAMEHEAQQAGFDVSAAPIELTAEEPYLNDVLPRLHGDYRGLDLDALRTLAGSLLMRKRRALNSEYPQETDHPQTLAHSLCRYAFVAPFVAGRRVLDIGCGAGLGTRALLAAGADSVIGLDRRPEALEIAREQDPRSTPEAWLEHDLEGGLPFAEASFDVVVALEVLEHVRAQEQLIAEIRRVLSNRGLAFISVPHRPFELFWAGLAGEPNPYHLHVPSREEFETMLADFAVVELSAQVDMVSSLVLPLADEPAANGDPGQQGTLLVGGNTTLSERGSIVLIAAASREESFRLSRPTPVAHAWGNHQESLGGAIQHNQDLDRWAETLRHERNGAVNRLRWGELGDLPEPLSAQPSPR